MVEQEVVQQMRVLREVGWGAKRIASELGLARNTVRRYLRRGQQAETQVRPEARRLDYEAVGRAVELWDGPAEGNAVVVQQLLDVEGIKASVRTVQRAVEGRRRQVHAAEVATVRFETAPGRQMQIDFGEKMVRIGGQLVKVFLLAPCV
jgi:transposase